MEADKHIMKLAEDYYYGNLSESDHAELEAKMIADSAFATAFQESLNLIGSLEAEGKQSRFRNMLKDIEQKVATDKMPQPKTIPLKTYYIRTGAIAASVALLTSLFTAWTVKQQATHKESSQYSVLKRELNAIKRSQTELTQKINTDIKPTPAAQARYTGTGFALTNDGYIVTSYHVTEGADSVYIQNKKGHYFKAYIVSFDQKTDVALLKVEDQNFKFGKQDVPYTFASNKKGLGTRIYTLGYPQEEIVYNEGYISAKNGYRGDSAQYRLEIPANPGQSGAPVLDANGNVVAMITGKETESEGITYAISSTALIELIDSLPKEVDLKLPKQNKFVRMGREQQVEKLETYTCAVKVYKK